MRLRVGARRSDLATTQATQVADALTSLGHQVQLCPIVTEGDVNQAPLSSMGGVGVFVSALRRALLADRIDLAVHSLKDLPTAPEPGLEIAGIPVRQDARDVLVSRQRRTLTELPSGAVIGTGAPRRVAQLANMDLGLQFRDIRGNVDTRIGLVNSGDLDAVVLARAGLARLGRLEDISETFDFVRMLPAAGQGALAIECRADDARTVAAAATLDDADTRAAVTAERALLAALEAGCTAPIGALAEVAEGSDGLELELQAVVAAPDGRGSLRRSMSGPVAQAEALGGALAQLLLQDGAAQLSDALGASWRRDGQPTGAAVPPRGVR